MATRNVWLLVALGVLCMVTVIVLMFEDTARIEQKNEAQYLAQVSVVNLQSRDHPGLIEVFAEVKPRWSVTLGAQVSGVITKIFDQSFAGSTVKKGTALINIEESPYLAELHQAEYELAEAELALLQQQKRSAKAMKDWRRSGIDAAPSDLALNKPQLKVARKRVAAAKSRVVQAQKNHMYTQIKAPISGVILNRHVSMGQSVSEGEALLHIIEREHQEIVVALTKQQWHLLSRNWDTQFAVIRDTNGVEVAKAQIKRGGGFLDPETRLYTLFLETLDNQPVLSGDFVQVALPGRIINDSLAIPESALTRDGLVWYLDDQDQLRTFNARARFHSNAKIIIDTPTVDTLGKHYPSRWRIAITPMASFLAGTRVKPLPVEGK
jgi:RND family efflux transporter MFP subunit